VDDVGPIQSVLKEPGPVEVSPSTKLQINKDAQNRKHNGVRHVFLIHHYCFKSPLRGTEHSNGVGEHGPT
jgi:hypothetical protein